MPLCEPLPRSWAGAWIVAPVSVQEPVINVVLSRAADYVAAYKQRLSGIVAEEEYRQQVMLTSRPGRRSNRQFRELRSDLLLVKPGDGEWWLQFRDVFEVDRKPIRDRDQRLYKLFVNAKSDPRQQAEIDVSYLRRTEVRIDGRASYGRFRQFTVTTSEKPKGQ